MKIVAAIASLVIACPLLFVQTEPISCRGLDGLVGEWQASGGGQPGQAAGLASFTPELQGKILVRRSYAEYPASKDKPAYRHDDLLIIYEDAATKSKRAIYFDNEGHVINYTVATSADGCTISLLSAPEESAPGYRLTYLEKSANQLDGKFEVAAPGKEFATYLQWSSRRKQ